MAFSPGCFTLYRRLGWAVICAVVGLGAIALANAQFAKKTPQSKGPRALGLLQLPANGKPALIPISIMVDGKFYDAAAYKAAPVPMALENGTVYEAFRTGKSLGLFTITETLTGNGRWLGAGTWLAAGAAPASTGHKAESKPRVEEEEGPPRLRKGKPGESAPAENKPAEAKAGTPTTAEKPQNSPQAGPSASTANTQVPAATVPVNAEPAPPEDADRPQLRRGVATKNQKPAAKTGATRPEKAANPTAPATRTSNAADGPNPGVQLVPAISDAAGPEPRSYAYEIKPEEEQAFREKMLTLAAEEIRKRVQEAQAIGAEPPASRKRASTGKPEPNFQQVTLRVFDVSTNNEPILVLTARVTPPEKAGAISPEYYITLVTRSDLYGELRKLFSAVTDDKHLDVTPRMELIDAVDADGDGRGELLFRQISDVGSAYIIYRVGADQLWALYEGAAAR